MAPVSIADVTHLCSARLDIDLIASSQADTASAHMRPDAIASSSMTFIWICGHEQQQWNKVLTAAVSSLVCAACMGTMQRASQLMPFV
jgi:hypothetical protein